MTTSEKLKNDLQTILSGQPWYGESIYNIFDKVNFEAAYTRAGHAHTIAEILLHLISWTEEVMDRLNGKPASLPNSGNWPHPGEPDEERLKIWIDDFKLVSLNLLKTIEDFPENKWDEIFIDERNNEPTNTYRELIYGFIQHQVYHSAQVSLLVSAIIG
ncbi:DinB family protein [Mucilaginibacter antarcticus]|uniref:DinB family protein n=1 Tax=Mucilaginibacter antarcticus TaxID=1855725 RepID=A0ABW5XK01_9SPHI